MSAAVGTPTGTVSINSTFNTVMPVGLNNLASYQVPTNVSVSSFYANGAGAGAIQKVAVQGATLTSTSVTIDLTAIPCTDGSTGFANIRELTIFNDATATGTILKYDLTGTTPFAAFLEGTLTTVKVDIAAGGRFSVSNYNDTAGWACGTNKNLKLDSGSSTIAYRLIIAGN